MATEIKSMVNYEDTFARLDIRVGRVMSVETAIDTPKPSYVMKIDFGKFGIKTSIGRYTQHTVEELVGKQVLGILNFESKHIGNYISEVLVLGVQYPKADSGDATFVTPSIDVKLGSKLF